MDKYLLEIDFQGITGKQSLIMYSQIRYRRTSSSGGGIELIGYLIEQRKEQV
jgi:hypothetical protein